MPTTASHSLSLPAINTLLPLKRATGWVGSGPSFTSATPPGTAAAFGNEAAIAGQPKGSEVAAARN
jgi:hypothetical protein